MPARYRRTDDFTDATEANRRGERVTVRIDPVVDLATAKPKRRVSQRLITVHEGPVHRVRVGRDTPAPRIGDEAHILVPSDLHEVPAIEPLPELERQQGLDIVLESAAAKGEPTNTEPPAFVDVETDPIAIKLPRSEFETLDEDDPKLKSAHAEIVDLQVASSKQVGPSIILSKRLQNAKKRVARDRPTQDMLPLTPSVAPTNWAATEIGPMPVEERPKDYSLTMPVVLVSGLALLIVAIVGGLLLYRTVAKVSRAAAPVATAAAPAPTRKLHAVGVVAEPESRVESGAVPEVDLLADVDPVPDVALIAGVEPVAGVDSTAGVDTADKIDDTDEEPVDVAPAVLEEPALKRKTRRARRLQSGPTHVVANTSSDHASPWLALRDRPRTSSTMRAKMSDGTRVRVYRERGAWASLRVVSGPNKGRRGWAHATWLSEIR